jgi:hypothetical protein
LCTEEQNSDEAGDKTLTEIAAGSAAASEIGGKDLVLRDAAEDRNSKDTSMTDSESFLVPAQLSSRKSPGPAHIAELGDTELVFPNSVALQGQWAGGAADFVAMTEVLVSDTGHGIDRGGLVVNATLGDPS